MHYPGQIIPRFIPPPLNQREITHPPSRLRFFNYYPSRDGVNGTVFRSGFFFQDFFWFLISSISLSLFLWICRMSFVSLSTDRSLYTNSSFDNFVSIFFFTCFFSLFRSLSAVLFSLSDHANAHCSGWWFWF